MYLVTQSFGKENEYRRAVLTILSYYAYTNMPATQAPVLLFTDNPAFFEPFFKGLPVTYVLLTPEKVKQMRGEIDFLHRMKIAVIEEAFTRSKDDILYADSDTFFIANPTPFMLQVQEQKCFMHLWEYRFEEMRDWTLPAGETFQAFLSLIESKRFRLTNGKEIEISPQHVSWNAGVMMLHSSHAGLIPDVYALTDQFYPDSLNHASEQYAFSVMLQETTEVQPCDAVIYHYWYRIKKQITDQFLDKKLNQEFASLSFDKKTSFVKKWTNELPHLFQTHELIIEDNAVQAFNENKFKEGYVWSLKVLLQKPLKSGPFLKVILYHTKRMLTKNA